MVNKKSTNKSAPKSQVRLKPVEQVKDKKKEAIGFGSSKATYQPYNKLSIGQIRQLIMNTVWAETCVETIVDEIVKYDLFTSNTDKESNKEIETFLEYPSDKEPLFLIRKQYLKDMLRWGNGGCIIEYKSGKPYGLVAVPGYTINVTDDNPPKYKLLKLGSTSEYLKSKSGKELTLKNEELMHFCINKDSDSTLGSSPIERAYNDITIDQVSAKKLVTFIQKGFYKPSFISFKKGNTINKKELTEFVEYLNGLMTESVKILGVNKDVELKEIPFWTADEIISMQKWVGLKVASVFKVPPFMLNLVQDTGSLNAREQKARFLENVVAPILKYESFLYTNILVRKGFKDLETKVMTTALGTKMNYDRAKIARILVGSTNELLTITEARKLFFNLGPITEPTNTEDEK